MMSYKDKYSKSQRHKILLIILLVFLVASIGVQACSEKKEQEAPNANLTVKKVDCSIKLPNIFSSNMVLQRDIEIPIWGWANPNEVITINVNKHQVSTRADAAGKWKTKLPALKVGPPIQIIITGKDSSRIVYENVLVGEVWICAGQSNMNMGVRSCQNAQQEISQANHQKIRLFSVPLTISSTQLSNIESSWRVCSSEHIKNFSGVAYFFGRELYRKLKVPIGLISSSWGGSTIEPWINSYGFKVSPELKGMSATYYKHAEQWLAHMKEWLPKAEKALATAKPMPSLPKPIKEFSSDEPTVKYNSMISPLIPFTIRGTIWYQGESNIAYDRDPLLYSKKMKALINGWRHVWKQGAFPFYYVQIEPWADSRCKDLPKLWEAQTAALAIENTGMIVTTDLTDNLNDPHIKNKQEAGRRLALWALAKTYDQKDLIYSGPLYKSLTIADGRVILAFDHCGTGLKSRDGKPLSWFTIAGKDRKFVKARAKINRKSVGAHSHFPG